MEYLWRTEALSLENLCLQKSKLISLKFSIKIKEIYLIDGRMLSTSPWRFVPRLIDTSRLCSTCERQTQSLDFLLNLPRIWKLFKNWLKFLRLGPFETHLNGNELDFHVCTTCGSVMPWSMAWSSKKSKMYLMASGRAEPRWAVLNIVSIRSSTNFWTAPGKIRKILIK